MINRGCVAKLATEFSSKTIGEPNAVVLQDVVLWEEAIVAYCKWLAAVVPVGRPQYSSLIAANQRSYATAPAGQAFISRVKSLTDSNSPTLFGSVAERMARAAVSAGFILALFSASGAQPTSTVVIDGASTISPLSGQLADVFDPQENGV